MIQEEKIKEYVSLFQRMEKKSLPLEKIDVLTNVKKVMCTDVMKELTNRGASNNWVRWWWNALKTVHRQVSYYILHLNGETVFGMGESALDDLFFRIREYASYDDNIGPGSEAELTGTIWTRYAEEFKYLNDCFPLQPNVIPPTVTTLDVFFYELFLALDRIMEKLSREAMVDGLVMKPEDALPEREYLKDNFIEYFLQPLPNEKNRDDKKARSKCSDYTDITIEVFEPDVPPRKTAPTGDKPQNVFEDAVIKTKDDLYSPAWDDLFPPVEDDGGYYEEENCEWVDVHDENVVTMEYYEYDTRKATSLFDLPAKLEFYLDNAEKILKKHSDEAKRYQALGRLYDVIDQENGGYRDDPSIQPNEIERSALAENLGLIPPDGKKRKTEVLNDYLKRVRALVSRGDDVTNIGGQLTIIDGWSWEPVADIYPAVVILDWLMINIREEMRNLHLQVKIQTGEDIPKHRFPVHGYLDHDTDEEKGSTGLRYVDELKYVTDEDLDPPLLPDWITGRKRNEEPVDVDEVSRVKVNSETVEKQINNIPIDCVKAQKLYDALSNEKLKWLVEPLEKDDFVNRLLLKPSGRKIKLKQLNQIRYITKNQFFPEKKIKKQAWELIMQLFEAEDGKIEGVKRANKTPQNSQIFDELMR